MNDALPVGPWPPAGAPLVARPARHAVWLGDVHTCGWLMADSARHAADAGVAVIETGRGNQHYKQGARYTSAPLYAFASFARPDPAPQMRLNEPNRWLGVVSAAPVSQCPGARGTGPLDDGDQEVNAMRALRVLVLATINPEIERAQVAAGNVVYLAAPPEVLARQETPGLAGTWAIRDWDDYNYLDALARELPDVDAVATMDEQAIRAAGFITDRRGLPGYTFGQAVAATDKHVMKLRLEAAGIPVARHRLARHPAGVAVSAAELGYPVVVKPRIGMAAMNTFMVDSYADLKRLEAEGRFDQVGTDIFGKFTASDMVIPLNGRRDGFLVEEGLKVTTEWFCDLLCLRGKKLLAAPGRYESPLMLASGGCADSGHYELLFSPEHAPAGVTSLAAAALDAICPGFSGWAHCEMFSTPDGLVFGELALRGAGAVVDRQIQEMYGIDLVTIEARLVVGQDPGTRFIARHPAVAAIFPTPPPGIVRQIGGLDELQALPGVLHADIHLEVGKPTPGWFGSAPLAGHILYAVSDPARIAEEISAVRSLLRITVDPDPVPDQHAASAATSEHSEVSL